MSLDASISTSVDRIDEVLNLIVGHLNGARGPSVPEFALLEITSAKTRLAAIRAECNAIRACMAAGRATGQVEKPVSVEELELHPKQLPAQVEHERLLASLHRAGDHTLDEDDNTDATQRVPTAGGGA